jgi:hypothetical protein
VSKHGYAPRPARRWAVLCALGCTLVAQGTAVAEEAAPSADDCVRAESQVRSKGIDVQLENSCDVKLSCRLRYVLSCSTNDGRHTSRINRQESFRLGGKDKHELSLSAEECKQSWDIDKIEWACQ